MTWTPTTDPTSTWTNPLDPTSSATRHKYGAEAGKTTRVRYGSHVRYGGIKGSSWTNPDDPSSSWTGTTDPTNTWTDVVLLILALLVFSYK